jgi:hypothetical protein
MGNIKINLNSNFPPNAKQLLQHNFRKSFFFDLIAMHINMWCRSSKNSRHYTHGSFSKQCQPKPSTFSTSNSTNNKRRALVIACIWPEKKASAAGVRTWNIVDLLLEHNYDVSFISPGKQNSYPFYNYK